VLKPSRGAGGSGIVIVVARRGDRFVTASGRSLAWRDVAVHAADVVAGVHSMGGREDALLVEARVEPVPALGPLANGGVPDVRVLVLRGVPLLAMMRLPTRRSDGRANLHLGGIGVGVDLATGRTTHAIAGRRAVAHHPDTDVPLAGIDVPDWEAILRVAVRAADATGLGFLGVDVVLDARAGPLVLELNARPGLAIQLANRRGARRLLEHVAAIDLPAGADARVALGRSLAR
jgi:alpha-L-glutamate ligase-like protein